MSDEDIMRLAIDEARTAEASGEVPVGAIIVSAAGEVIASGNNRVLRDHDPTAHAEIVALRAAGIALNNYRLLTADGGCTLYCTLEPCAMCAGAILHARIARLVYAAPDPKAGACGSVLSVMNHTALNHRVEVVAGVMSEECSTMLTTFFRARRSRRTTSPTSCASDKQKENAPMATRKSAGKESPASKSTAKKASRPKPSTTPPSKRWSAKVTTDSTKPAPGLFKQSAKVIADGLAKKSVSPKGPGQGMQMLNFYENRGGKNLSPERKEALEDAKLLLHQKVEAAAKQPAKKSSGKKAAKKTAHKSTTKKKAS